MFVLDFHVNYTQLPNSCKLVVPRLGVLSLYPVNLQWNGLRSLCVCLLPSGSAETVTLISTSLTPQPPRPPHYPITPRSLSSQTVCHLIQLFFKADTLGSSPQTSVADAPRVTSATVCKVRAFKRHRCKRYA